MSDLPTKYYHPPKMDYIVEIHGKETLVWIGPRVTGSLRLMGKSDSTEWLIDDTNLKWMKKLNSQS